MKPTTSAERVFDVLIIGGGNAGISAAARLIRRGIDDVAVIESQAVHTYRPLLSYVGGGAASMRSAERTQRSVTPRGCTWLREPAVAVDADARTVRCADGLTYGYRDLILAAGLVPDEEALPGTFAALDHAGVASNYVDRAEKTWELVRTMPRGGHAVFTVPRPPVSCSGTTIKPVFLAAAHWKRSGLLPGVTMTLLIDRPSLLGAPALDESLNRYLTDVGVQVSYDTAVTALHPERREITVTDADGTRGPIRYDMLHLVPPFRGPEWVTESHLEAAGSHGLVDVDSRTFRHRVHPDVWAVGDCATVDTDPSGGAIRRQTSILVDNLLAARGGATSLTEYDGYTVAPVTTDRRHLVFGEFDRSGEPASSLPAFIDPLKAHGFTWALDRYGLPVTYWNLILKGLA
ncbi:NAD(P)/FAD-dependent oxidoreductase [Mycolicibacterium sediminis]|uniref:Pyridine nucleotide-disulfide oxidoreductase n=1 Tax=Mycolicibacterium sediminis TaxID=1286180 RepID=A0A7I7QS40_9MYCO|nr:FAD/NAD(P)-binding oxidoreductase [Mycolicibacterium sediminis]BBY29042.1 pyridine nucleotide-disulfide oxidoreductase [Mycolicibacterium sediminis]